MSVTYSEDRSDALEGRVHVPAYARGRTKRRKGLRTWMILAPIGAVILGGAAAVMIWGGGEETAPLAETGVETATTAPMLAPTGLAAQPAVTPAADPVAQAAAPEISTATAMTELAAASPPAAPVVQRRASSARAPSAERAIEPPVEPTGPRPYLSDAGGAPQAATPPAPAITVQPLG